MRCLEDYSKIIGDEMILKIHKKVRKLYKKLVININSTPQAGGVAEILMSLVPLMNDVGVDSDWRIIKGNTDFFTVTKKFHNALQGDPIHFTERKKQIYLQASENYAAYTKLNYDYIVIHDPQPLPLIRYYKKRQPWIWRCHIDLSEPDPALWEFLKGYILKYDIIIVSCGHYIQDNLPAEYRVIPPAIDPFSPKNTELTEPVIHKLLKKYNIPTDKPLFTQISRFDKWKDPEGVIKVFEMVKQEVDCRLVLCGSMAMDDPEGWAIYNKVKQRVSKQINNGDVILITSEDNALVNALQRASAVIIQKSIREGFGLTVTEALWKGTPVIASEVGGISAQIKDGRNGYLFKPQDNEGFAKAAIKILKDPDLARELGDNGKETVRERFLMPRLLDDYLSLFIELA